MNHATERRATRPEGDQNPNTDGIRRAEVPHIEEAERMFERGNAAGALRRLDSMIRDGPSPHLYLRKAMILTEMKKYKSAASCCRQALQLDKNCGWAYGELGLILRRGGKPAKAVSYLNKAIKIVKREEPADGLYILYTNKGAALLDMRKWEESIRWCDRAIDLDPNQVSARFNKYVSLMFLERPEEAKECLDAAGKIDMELTLRYMAQLQARIHAHLDGARQPDVGDSS